MMQRWTKPGTYRRRAHVALVSLAIAAMLLTLPFSAREILARAAETGGAAGWWMRLVATGLLWIAGTVPVIALGARENVCDPIERPLRRAATGACFVVLTLGMVLHLDELSGMGVYIVVVGIVLGAMYLPPPEPPPLNACDRCGYDLAGITGDRCPECGAPA